MNGLALHRNFALIGLPHHLTGAITLGAHPLGGRMPKSILRHETISTFNQLVTDKQSFMLSTQNLEAYGNFNNKIDVLSAALGRLPGGTPKIAGVLALMDIATQPPFDGVHNQYNSRHIAVETLKQFVRNPENICTSAGHEALAGLFDIVTWPDIRLMSRDDLLYRALQALHAGVFGLKEAKQSGRLNPTRVHQEVTEMTRRTFEIGSTFNEKLVQANFSLADLGKYADAFGVIMDQLRRL